MFRGWFYGIAVRSTNSGSRPPPTPPCANSGTPPVSDPTYLCHNSLNCKTSITIVPAHWGGWKELEASIECGMHLINISCCYYSHSSHPDWLTTFQVPRESFQRWRIHGLCSQILTVWQERQTCTLKPLGVREGGWHTLRLYLRAPSSPWRSRPKWLILFYKVGSRLRDIR